MTYSVTVHSTGETATGLTEAEGTIILNTYCSSSDVTVTDQEGNVVVAWVATIKI